MKRILLTFTAVLCLLMGCTTAPMKAPPVSVEVIDTEAVDTEESSGEENVIPDAKVEGVKIALLDTGISTTAIDATHILSGHNYVTDSEDTEDRINHGTAVSSIIAGCESAGVEAMADNAYLIPLVVVDKVDGDTKSVAPEVLAQAITDSIDIYGADLINVSLGIQKDAPALRKAVAYAEEQGVLVISAVGNGGEDESPYYPASYDTVLAVGACDDKGNKSDFTQNGAEVLAPGERIMLASRNGVSYGVKGTSFATGFVSAAAANLLKEEPTLTPKELYRKIIDQADSYGGYLPSGEDVDHMYQEK